eukprot:TRINITY_DN33855_c0_g1_i1.p1 TRINITY_DN33855_c0_g1~~TRINITY_DN33855_c0_g1_i1.p1  ORF type:complete len:593 (-),score=120.67 TRINITY_DN33855_c0_g1_i1:30-1808(-)
MSTIAIELQSFEMHKQGSTVIYTMQLSSGGECWMVTRRYSEFLRCHVRLLELFDREQLPYFPPKEPLLQKIFGWGDSRIDWLEERCVKLQSYVLGLLSNAGALRSEVFLDLLNSPRKAGRTVLAGADVALICGVRVRLTGEPGGVEVVVRAEAAGPCSVRLALRPLPKDSEDWESDQPTLDAGLLTEQTWERFLELDLDPSKSCEVSHRFSLEAGSLWQVAAVGVGWDGTTGTPVCIQLRAPSASDVASLPITLQGKSPDDEKGAGEQHASDTSQLPLTQGYLPGEGCCPSEDRGEEAELSRGDEEIASDPSSASASPCSRSQHKKRSLSSPAHKVISFQGCAAVEYARRIEESQRLAAARAPHRWERSDGKNGRSVPVEMFSVAAAAGAQPERRMSQRTAQVLDNSIQAQQQQQLREDEVRTAAWLYAVTGAPAAGEASAGCSSLEAALQSGEVLCDLVNAIWPGRIVGIARGEAAQKHFRRIANITQFVQSCTSIGVDASSLFVPSDLVEGKNFRSVIRCIWALALLVPEAFEGPHLFPRSGEPAGPSQGSSPERRRSGQARANQNQSAKHGAPPHRESSLPAPRKQSLQ